jgi:hypothetical protein
MGTRDKNRVKASAAQIQSSRAHQPSAELLSIEKKSSILPDSQTDTQYLERIKTMLDMSMRQIVSIRDTGYKLLVGHATVDLGICLSLLNPLAKSVLKPHPILTYSALLAIWFLFSWWQVSLYLSAGRMNAVFEQCLALLAKNDVVIPGKGPWLARRRFPALLMPFLVTLIAIVWSVLILAS